MNDPDLTLPLPMPAPPGGRTGVTPAQAGALMAAGRDAFATQPSKRAGPWQPPTVEALQRQLPQYEIAGFVARGGMGAVYKATQRSLKRVVAVKVLPQEICEDDDPMQFTARFKQEAQAMAHLSHPNIVAVFDAGETPDGLLYFVMEFLEGTDVAQLIEAEGRLPAARAVAIITAVCDALTFAHEEGIIHRDIKPSNVMLDKRGRVKVADFGLAKAAHLESALMTRSDVAMGTPDFIAPEMLSPGTRLDGRADIYAVGVMFYQMLTGAIPRGRFGLPSSIVPQMDKGLDAIVDRAMQTDRERRYSTAGEMRTALETTAAAGRDSGPAQAAAPAITRTRPGRSRATLIVGLIAGTSILAAGAFLVLQKPEPESAPNPGSGPGAARAAATTAQASSASPSSTGTKVDDLWKARWHKPGRLQAAGTDMKGRPFDLKAAEPFDDFVQVVAVEPAYYSGRSWVGLRTQGDMVWSDGLVERNRVALSRTPTGVISIGNGGRVSLPFMAAPAEPVTDLSAAMLNGLPGKIWVLAYADAAGTWHLSSNGYDSGVLDRPDTDHGPKVAQIVVGSAGTGVLREDGTLRLWNQREMKLPEALARGVRAVEALGNQWAALKDDGRILTFTLAKAANDGTQMLPEPSAIRESMPHDKFLASALGSGGHAPLARLADGRWTTGSPGVVEDTLKTLHTAGNESFCVMLSKEAESILWIEPSK